jgi:predicted acetyltransferase
MTVPFALHGPPPILVRPSPEWRDPFFEMAREFAAEGDPRYEAGLADFAGYLASVARFEAGVSLPPDRVHMSEWWLSDGERLLGGVRLRHRLIPVLERDGGNIGYDVRPSARGRGLGHRILALALERARANAMTRVLLTCEHTNAASIRVIEAGGGVSSGQAISPVTGAPMWRYWVELGASDPVQ